jgi:hypothetical protein
MMEFEIIDEGMIVHPGEYILHKPSNQIVLCGAFKRKDGKIKVLARGRLMEDNIENFQKIKLSKEERKQRSQKRCRGCKKK